MNANKIEFEELHIGLSESFKVKITDEMLDLFIKISGDKNPMHSSEEYAKNKNYPSKVIHGLLSSSFYSTLVGMYLPGEKCLLHGIDISFRKPVFVGDKLEIYGEIILLNEVYKVAEIKAYIKNQSGEKISTAKIRVGVI